MALKTENITFDTTDPEKLAEWWARALDGQVNPVAPPFFIVVSRPDGPGLAFQKVDDPTPGKNRVHVDLAAREPDAEIERLLGLGAELVDPRRDGAPAWRGREGIRWVVLRDTEGNEFCIG